MKDYRINGKMQRVFVLSETDERLVYIPVKALHEVDYVRLRDIEAKYPEAMLKGLQRTKLDNGRNALVQYDRIIQVMIKTDKNGRVTKGVRLDKMGGNGPIITAVEKVKTRKATTKTAGDSNTGSSEDKPVQKRKGRKPGSKNKPKVETTEGTSDVGSEE